MAKPAFLRSQIVNVVLARLGYERYLLDDRYAIDLKATDLLWVVGQYAYFLQSEVAADFGANTIISLVNTETELQVGVNGVEALLLELVGAQLV